MHVCKIPGSDCCVCSGLHLICNTHRRGSDVVEFPHRARCDTPSGRSLVKHFIAACEALAGASVSCIIENREPWFKEIDVASALKYGPADKAIRMHVADDDKLDQSCFNSNPIASKWLKGN